MKTTMCKGFTLIELVIVLVLLGILIAVALPKYQDLSGSAMNASSTAAVDAVTSAYATAKTTANGYPTTDQVISSMTDSNTLTYTAGKGFTVNAKVTIPAMTSVTNDCASPTTNGATGSFVCSLGSPTVIH